MSILNFNESNVDKRTELPSGNIDEFISEMQAPKQDMNIDESEGLDELEDLQENETVERQDIDVEMTANASKMTSKLLCTVLDSVIPNGLSLIAGDAESVNLYKASDEQRDELEEALTAYIRLKGGDIPPGIMVIILVITIYGSKIPLAIQQRKLNKEKELLKQQQQELERQRLEFEREKEIYTRNKVREVWEKKEQQSEPHE